MRVGLIALLHESNTFVSRPTTWDDFAAHTLLEGEAIRAELAATHHEIGGFFEGVERTESKGPSGLPEPAEVTPVFAARALPSGTIDARSWERLLDRMFQRLDEAGPLDGILVAPHGATVSERYPDADGHWLTRLRAHVGPQIPLIGTLDAHANVSPAMVDACNALTAYRTNPHLDQRQRGVEAGQLMVRTLRGEINPVMHAEFLPMAINIERQMTGEPHFAPFYKLADEQIQSSIPLSGGPAERKLLTNSIVLGFPYADVEEMGSSVLAVADGDKALAEQSATQLARALWSHRELFVGQLIDVDEALDRAAQLPGPVCLLDMGDNVGGGSAADGTFLAQALHDRRLPSFVCIFDPAAVAAAELAGIGAEVDLQIGGHSDSLHGPPLCGKFVVQSLHDGRFRETRPRHGGMSEFDQGRTAIVRSERGLTVMLTQLRMVPFSLAQLTSCQLDPAAFQILVAKGVNAPVAAYQEVCPHLIRVNTPGSTCADMLQLEFHHRRRPLFPFEPMS